jgi:hypothetical protein
MRLVDWVNLQEQLQSSSISPRVWLGSQSSRLVRQV